MISGSRGPGPLQFKPIGLPERERMESIRVRSGSTLYTYAFASLFAWASTERYSVNVSDDAFLVRYGGRGEQAYLFPCGTEEGKKKFIDVLMETGRPVFYSVSDEDRAFVEKTYPGMFVFEECRDDFPYLYDRKQQIALDGKEYKSLRHEVNYGRNAAGEWTSEQLNGHNVERALAVNRKWAETRSAGDVADLIASETALRHFSDLGMWGVLFQADGEDRAYVAGTFITPQIFDICFCKVLDKRCDCYVKWELYRLLPPEVNTVDSEEDMGLEGLRRHKLLRRPKTLVRVWKGQLT